MFHKSILGISAIVIGLCCFIDTVRAQGSCPTGKVYTYDMDFDLGSKSRVNNDTASDQLRLDPPPDLYPYINIACLKRGTVIRLFVGTADDDPDQSIPETIPPYVVGEYWTGPATGDTRTPSRTAVDHRGNVWVGARLNSAVTRIALLIGGTRCDANANNNPTGQYLKPPFDYCGVGAPPNGDWQLLDRHGATLSDSPDGLIKTSRALGNILTWDNSSGDDTDGGVRTAEDELLITYVGTQATDVRSVAIDGDNNLWAGGFGNHWQEKISGDVTTWADDNLGGASIGTPVTAGCGGYGGLVDHSGVLWSAYWNSSLLRYDPLL